MGNHWAVVQGRRYACGLTKKPVPFSAVPHRCARVTSAHVLVRVAEVEPTTVIPAAPKREIDPERREAVALAARYGITLESVSMYDRLNPDLDGVFVYPPSGLYDEDGENDPLNGNRVGFSWGEVLDNVKLYRDAIVAKQNEANTLADKA